MENYGIGAITIALITFLGTSTKLFFDYLKNREKNGDKQLETQVMIFEAIQKQNNNHLHHVELAIKEGNKSIIKAINELAKNIKKII